MFMEKLKFIMSKAFEFLLPFIKVLLTEGGRILMQAAQEAVVVVATTMAGQPGAAKRDAAFAIIQQRLSTEGVTMATAVINSAIEAAVVKLKES